MDKRAVGWLGVVSLAALSAAAASAADSPTLSAPVFHPGDSWVFDDVGERGSSGYDDHRIELAVQDVDGDTMTIGFKREGAPTGFEAHAVGTDWSQRRLIGGEQTVVSRPFAFPMAPGKRWSIDFNDLTRRGNQISLYSHKTYKVLGWRDIDVPAGNFHALEIESTGTEEGRIDVPATSGSLVAASPGQATSLSHAQRGGIAAVTNVTRFECFYVPSVKYCARTVEEKYNTDNVRLTRDTRNLVRFTPGA